MWEFFFLFCHVQNKTKQKHIALLSTVRMRKQKKCRVQAQVGRLLNWGKNQSFENTSGQESVPGKNNNNNNN